MVQFVECLGTGRVLQAMVRVRLETWMEIGCTGGQGLVGLVLTDNFCGPEVLGVWT